ncbi:MAG: hypothetical protein KGY45_04780 [Hadesarchaea archaeon]|nr:hypothetical protein [Hadesarchaea archaeon]
MDLLERRLLSGILITIIGVTSIIVGVLTSVIELFAMFIAGGGFLVLYGSTEAKRNYELIKILEKREKEIQREEFDY